MAEHHHGYPPSHRKHESSTTTTQLLAVLTLFPIAGLCFLLSGLLLAVTLIGLTISTPLFFIFSPILLPAMVTVALMVAGFLTSGGVGITAVSLLAYIVNYFRRSSNAGRRQDQLDHHYYAKRRDQDDATGYVGQKVKDMERRAQEMDWA